jgi:enhancer of mRNA-decapping protein 3
MKCCSILFKLVAAVEGEYVTDTGLVVPCIDLSLRNRLMASAEAKGFSSERMTELMARSGAELSMQLLGGERRLNPSNSHQV